MKSVASFSVTTTAGGARALPGRGIAAMSAVGAAAAVQTATGWLASPAFTLFAVAAILVFGLPHGALDIALLKRAGLRGRGPVVLVVAGYCGVAALMLALWIAAPALALASFLIVGVAHFAEDWTDTLPPFLAVATAAALITGPAVFQGTALFALFDILGGVDVARTLVAVSTTIAPTALIAALVGIVVMAQDEHRELAVMTAASLAAMVMLPPLAGFAVFFCAVHSPTNYARALRELGQARRVEARRETVWLTSAALAIAIGIGSMFGGMPPEAQGAGAAFVTLSVLTVPHMLAGTIGRRLKGSV